MSNVAKSLLFTSYIYTSQAKPPRTHNISDCLIHLFSPCPRATTCLPALLAVYCTGGTFDLYGSSGTRSDTHCLRMHQIYP